MPHGISKKALEKFLIAVPWDKVVKKAEHAEEGTRIWPPNTNKDAVLNFRIDKGATLGDKKSEVILQANKDAQDRSVKKAAQKDSNQALAKGIADPLNDEKGDSLRGQIKEGFDKGK